MLKRHFFKPISATASIEMNQQVAVAGMRRRMKTLQPTRKTGEACRRLGLTLPPLQVQTQRLSNKRAKSKNYTKASLQPRPTVIFGHSLSDYVTKPSYFCHPVVVPALASADPIVAPPSDPKPIPMPPPTDSFPSEAPTCVSHQATERQRRTATVATSPPRRARESKSVTRKGQSGRRTSQKFLEFCQNEGFDPSSSEFTKVSYSFRNVKKFGAISKATCLVPLTEDSIVTATKRNAADLTLRLRRNETIQRTKRQNASGRKIRENAREAAAKGQDAAAKAITFILRDPRESPSKNVVLPPIKGVSSIEGSINTRDLITEAPR